jgi:hypothetical protein
LFSRGSGGANCGVAVTTAVDEIAPENDDRHRAGDSPVCAAVRSEAFAGPFVQHVLVVVNYRGAVHVRSRCFGVITENPLDVNCSPGGQSNTPTSLMIDVFMVCESNYIRNRPDNPTLCGVNLLFCREPLDSVVNLTGRRSASCAVH